MATLHLIIAISTGLAVLYTDEQALLWVLGKTKLMNPRRVRLLHYLVTGGLTALLITGGILYYPSAIAYITLPTFQVKMIMVLALICNSYFISRFSQTSSMQSYAELSRKEQRVLLASGVVSFIGWVTAFICGLLIA